MPLSDLFTQLQDGQAFSIYGGDRISDLSAIRYGYFIIAQCTEYKDACRVWRAKADADKATMIQFKAHFRLAEQDIREAEEDTTGSLGFHGSANAMVPAADIAPHVANQVIGAQPPPRRVPTPASYCWSRQRRDLKACTTRTAFSARCYEFGTQRRRLVESKTTLLAFLSCLVSECASRLTGCWDLVLG
jgi:hypothetical protein